jgi:hypothetical protein
MTSIPIVSVLGSEFDDFLFAPIGEDKNGTPLSVFSALARLEIDPWEEGAKLAHLPEEAAIQSMASLIVELPNGPPMHPPTTATRLIALLPRGPRSNMSSRETLSSVSSVNGFEVAVCVIFIALGTHFFVVSHLSSARSDSIQALVPGTVLLQAPPQMSP